MNKILPKVINDKPHNQSANKTPIPKCTIVSIGQKLYVSHNTNIMLDQLPLWDDEPFLAVGRFFPAGFIRLLHNVNLFYNFAQGFITRSTKESRIDQENTLTFYVW